MRTETEVIIKSYFQWFKDPQLSSKDFGTIRLLLCLFLCSIRPNKFEKFKYLNVRCVKNGTEMVNVESRLQGLSVGLNLYSSDALTQD